ncbi:MAG: FAD-dependent oxidoreductase, partial [Bacteroidales bacterium]|nr:FAD-dependent oxidoreductase [Bacteroidales bacterium]
LERENVYTAPQIIHREKVLRDAKVIVAGSGMTGLETAEILCQTGNEVTVLEMADEIAPGTWFQLVDDEMERLAKTGTRFETGTKLLAVDERGVLVEDAKSGLRRRLEADALVLSLGVRPAGDLARELDKLSVTRIWRVGDAVKSGTIADACHSAYDTVMFIR